MITVVLAVLAILGWAAAAVFAVVARRFGLFVFAIERQIENSLDVLDLQYKKITSVLTLPLASDDVFARTVIDAIKQSRDTVMLVANLLTGVNRPPTENGDDSE